MFRRLLRAVLAFRGGSESIVSEESARIDEAPGASLKGRGRVDMRILPKACR